MRRRVAVAAVLLFIMAPPGAYAAAGDRIWSALTLATIEPSAASVPESLKKLAPAINEIFGYNSLYLVGEKSATCSVAVRNGSFRPRNFSSRSSAFRRS